MSELSDFNHLFYGKYPNKHKGLYSVSEKLLGKHTFDTTLAFKMLESAARERDYEFIDGWAKSICKMLKLQHKSVVRQIINIWHIPASSGALNMLLLNLNRSEELYDEGD